MINIRAIVRDGGINTSALTGTVRVSFLLDNGQTKQMGELLELREKSKVVLMRIRGEKGTVLDISAGIWKISTEVGGGIVFVFELKPGEKPDVTVKLAQSANALELLNIGIVEDDRYESFERTRSRKTAWTTSKRELPN